MGLTPAQMARMSRLLDEALELFERAHRLSPKDRACALLFAEATATFKGRASLCKPSWRTIFPRWLAIVSSYSR